MSQLPKNPNETKAKRKVIGANQKLPEKKILEAINGSGGVISYIANRLGVDWHTADRLIKRNEVLMQAYRDELEKILDICESTLYSSIKEGDTGSAKWYLTQRGKHRGYGDKLELTGEMNANVTINIIGVDSERDKD